MIKRSIRSFYRSLLLLAIGSLFIMSAALSAKWDTARAAGVVTWDGRGSTNNWSDAANWSGGVVPGSGDQVIFDSTSTKDVTIDTNISVSSIRIDIGYTGTITQTDAASITISGCPGQTCFTQNNGTFNGSANTISLSGSGFGALSLTGGAFNGGTGDITVVEVPNQTSDVSLQGGVFKSTAGNLILPNGLNIGTASFVHNSGTIKFIGDQNSSIIAGASDIFNNVNIDKSNADISVFGPVVVAGNLSLNDGSISNNDNIVEARGDFSISPDFDGGNATLEFANGSVPRHLTFATGVKLPKVDINDPNVTIDTSGTGTLHFPDQLVIDEGVFNQDSADLLIETLVTRTCFQQTGGTFNGSAGTITINGNGFGAYVMTGGTFNGGTGDITVNEVPNQFNAVSLEGGIFKSTAGTLSVPDNFTIQGSSFVHNSGAVVFFGTRNSLVTSGPGDIFNNVIVNKSNVGLGIVNQVSVQGTLSLNNGSITGNEHTIEARGDLSIAPEFDGGDAILQLANGIGPRNLTLSTGINLPRFVINDPNVTVDTAGTGTLHFPRQLALDQGVFNQDGVDLLIEAQGVAGSCYLQNGGIFNASSNTITINPSGFGAVLINGGTFNGGSGPINLIGATDGGTSLNLQGGTFKSTSGTLTMTDTFLIQGTGTTFLHNNGTVNFTAAHSVFLQSPPITFNNVKINLANLVNLGIGQTMIVLGELDLNDGTLNQGSATIEARGPTVVGPNFDGGVINFTFGGTANQTFTNNGGVNLGGTWTINKTSGIVTAASSLILGTSQPLNITSGSLFLANGSNLTAGAITIGTNGKLINDTSSIITLGGDVSNTGTVDLQGGGAACPEPDTILLRSSAPGTRRNWSGTGVYRLVDVDVQDQGGTASITVFSGTNSGNNGANFTFTNSCPTQLSISPQTTGAVTGTQVSFTAGGGFGTRTFSIPVNHSGATINPSTGLYTAGSTPDVSDTVRVTDGLGNTADANVDVTGPAVKLAFTVQPSSTTAGQTISPSVQVSVEDTNGVTVTNATNLVALAFANNAGSGTLSGTLSHNAVNGVATFDNISINKTGVGYTLKATASGLTQATSAAFNINAASSAKLVFSVQPQDTSITSVITPPVQITVEDTFGNTVTNANNSISIGIGNNPGNATLTGTNPETAVNGVATFTDLNLNNPGNGYTLTASATSLTGATSTSFNVTSPFIVTNTNDSGAGSLRDAINNANSAAGFQTIGFNIPGNGPFVITPLSTLPTITDAVNVDGTTQPGFGGSPLIELHGSAQVSLGLDVSAGGSTIKGLALMGFANSSSSGVAVKLDGKSGNTKIQGDWIGISANGASAANDIGVAAFESNDQIGGPDTVDRNVISGNKIGVSINTTNTMVENNFIGTDQSGATAVGNVTGVSINGGLANNNNTVENNVISGNTDGIVVGNGVFSTQNLIQGNIIGLDASGTNPLGNTHDGINIGDFGTRTKITANQIFGNGSLGIVLGNRTTGASGPPLPNDPQDVDGGANGKQNYPLISSLNVQPSSLGIGGSLNSTPSSTFTLEFFASPSCDASGNGEGARFLGSGSVTTGAGGFGTFNFTLPVSVDTSEFVTATATDANGNTSEFSQCSGLQFSIQGNAFVIGSNAPISGATVKFHNSTTNVDTFQTTDSAGHFGPLTFSKGQVVGVTIAKLNFQVSSTSTTFDGNGDQTIRFEMEEIASTIRGQVTLNGSSLSGVTMTLSGSANATAFTDSSGNYRFANLAPGGTYTITPSLQNFTFSPTSTTLQIFSDQTANFSATNLLANLPGRIVFESNGNINTMNANGTGLATIFTSFSSVPFRIGSSPSALPAGSGSEDIFYSPNFSSSGAKLAFFNSLTSFTSTSSTTTTSLQASNPDGSSTTGVIANGAAPLGRVNFSPDGTKLASGKLVNGITQLVTVKVSDGSITPVLTSGTTNTDPDWSPDGTQLVFARDDSTTPGTNKAIFVVDSTGANLSKKTTPSFSDTSPRWSPDGTKIAFLRSTGSGGPTEVVTMNANGTGQSVIYTTSASQIFDLRWAPDSSRLALLEGTTGLSQLVSILPDGTSKLVITRNVNGSTFDWSPTPLTLVPIGSNINVNIGNINLGFTSVSGLQFQSATSSAPTVDAELIEPASAGTPPAGYVLGDIAYQITTDAAFTAPVTVCIDVPADQYPTADAFNEASLLHDENGTLVDVTTSRDISLHRICGQVNTLGNFVIAEQINNTLPRISGLVIDQDGNPLDDFTISLSGDETQQATTGFDGSFDFVDLTDGGSYLVTPTRVGYVFDAPFQGYDSLSGEQTVVFVATPANFSISGTVRDGNLVPQENVTVTLRGTADAEVITGADGTYVFDNLPANGTYFVTPSLPGISFSPQQLTVDALQNDLQNADFVELLPTAAPVSVAGRVVTSQGFGILGARLAMTNAHGETRTVLSNAFGYYRFDNVLAGETYILTISSKRYRFGDPTRVLTVDDQLSGVNFKASP